MLAEIVGALTDKARALGLTDTAWADRAQLRKDSLSRLRRRETCDFATLRSLAQAVGARLGVVDVQGSGTTPDSHFPAAVDRDYEDRLIELGASGNLDQGRWAATGPRFFMAGLAVMLASTDGRDRRRLLALAEQLQPGSSEPAVFNHWLERSPLRPTRFLSLLDIRVPHAA
ncbi:MAG: hypothetical protein ABI661_02940 [Gammaproteobacteria bacterium]